MASLSTKVAVFFPSWVFSKTLCKFKQSCITNNTWWLIHSGFLRKIKKKKIIYSYIEFFLKAIKLFQSSGLVFTKVCPISHQFLLLGVVMFLGMINGGSRHYLPRTAWKFYSTSFYYIIWMQHILDCAVGSPTRECLSVCGDTFLEGKVAISVLSFIKTHFSCSSMTK